MALFKIYGLSLRLKGAIFILMMKYITLMMLVFPSLAFAADPAGYEVFFHTGYNPSLITFGIILIALEIALPTKGLLGLAGVALFVAGTSTLATHPDPDWRLSWPMILLLDALVIGISAVIVYLTYKGYTARHDDITDDLLNKEVTVLSWNGDHNTVEIGGAIWKAVSDHHFIAGDKAIVTKHDNLTLHIIPKGEAL